MSNPVPVPRLSVWTPHPPDFHMCDQAYGKDLRLSDCFAAVSNLPEGEGIMSYSINGLNLLPWNLPQYRSHGSCSVTIEVAGPVEGTYYNIAPSTIRGLAGWVIDRCIISSHGIGGFVTYELSSFIDPIVGSTVERFPEMALPGGARFLTVTVSGILKRLPSPGNTDPAIPQVISEKLGDAAGQSPRGSQEYDRFESNSMIWTSVSQSMTRGGNVPWWTRSASSSSDEMAYECDAALGSPAEADCAQIEWNQLGPASVSPPSDTVSVGPGKVQFLHSNSCVLAISAALTTVLSWAQIRAAVAALMNTCIQAPFQSPKGGRAYYRPPITFPAIVPRDDAGGPNHSLKRQTAPTALNALPSHTNITMFAQKESWGGAIPELRSCTWEAVVGGRDVASCK